MKNKFDEDKQSELIKELKTKFGAHFWVKPGYAWSSKAVLWSGEDCFMPDGTRAFDSMAYEHDSEEKIYVMGVHRDLIKWSESKGLFWEPNDSATYIAYEG